jgi:predicted aspartyl protease
MAAVKPAASKHKAGEAPMGLTHVTVKVADLQNQGTPYEADFLVDTGAVDCMAPADALEAAQIKPEGKALYELASGEPVEYEYGFAWLSFMGEKSVSRIIFGPPNTEPILGVVALEGAGMIVDPVSQKIKRMHAKPLKRFADKRSSTNGHR